MNYKIDTTNILKNEKEIKNYRILSIVLLFLALYVVFFPFLSKILEKILPMFVICPYKFITNKNCPFCGGTRYIAGIYNVFNDISYLFCPFGAIVIFVLFEIIFRIYVIFLLKRINKAVILFDIIIHVIAALLLLIYVITFFLK